MSNKIQDLFPSFQTESRLEPVTFFIWTIAIVAGRGKMTTKERPLSSLGAKGLVDRTVFFCDLIYIVKKF